MNNLCAFLVRDYMHTDVHTIDPDATLKEALATMVEEKTNSLIVLEGDELVGMLSSWDLIARLVPSYLETDQQLAAFESGEVFCRRAHAVEEVFVREMMSAEVHTVTATETLIVAASLLVQYKIRHLPVVDEQGRLIGLLNRTDLKRAMAHALDLEA